MREAIHALKYDRLHPIARGLGQMLAEAIAHLYGEAPAEMLMVPVPLHRSKYRQRGFNQARAIATEALGFLRKSHPDWHISLAASTLMRLRPTESQAGLTPRQRRLNLRGAFLVSDASQVTARHILLVDDILTTGATARAAAQALVEAGAASVWVATLARAQRIAGFGLDSVYQDREDGEESAGSEPASPTAIGSIQSGSSSSRSSGPQQQPSF